MKVALVSTWGQACGIATYSEELAMQLGGLVSPLVVLAPMELGAGVRETVNVPVVPCWQRGAVDLADQLIAALRTPPGFDVVHFQHEHGLFFLNDAFLRAVSDAAKFAAVVVTLHTVKPYGDWNLSGFYDALRSRVHGIIVHTPAAAAALACARGPAPIFLVPHGAWQRPFGDPAVGRALLRVPADDTVPVGLVFGLQSRGKNTICTIRAWGEIFARRLISKGVLCIVGDFNKDENYFGVLTNAVRETGYDPFFRLIPGFQRVSDIPNIMAAARFGILNTDSFALSASGASHVFAAAGVALAVADRPIYTDAVRGGAVPFDVRRKEPDRPTLSCINAIGALARDERLCRYVGASLHDFIERKSWLEVAAKTLDVYKTVVENRRNAHA